jgi:hypothetical protein
MHTRSLGSAAHLRALHEIRSSCRTFQNKADDDSVALHLAINIVRSNTEFDWTNAEMGLGVGLDRDPQRTPRGTLWRSS